MRDPCDVEVARFAARHHSMVGVDQLRAAGLSASGVKWRAKTMRLHLATRGVYSTAPPAHRPPLADEAAAFLAIGSGAVLSHRTAAAMWGLAKRDPTTVEVIAPKQKRTARGSGSTERTAWSPDTSGERSGCPRHR